MTVLFICRGNTLRSIIAESYLRSLAIPGVEVASCGTVAAENKTANADNFQVTLEVLAGHGLNHYAKHDYGQGLTQTMLDDADIAVCMNQVVRDEAAEKVDLPSETLVWDVNDVDEGGRVINTIDDRRRYSEEIFTDICARVDALVQQRLTSEQVKNYSLFAK